MKLIIVTGLSGAGRSSALRALEDLGLRCVDNLPVVLLKSLVEYEANEGVAGPLAIGVDSRSIGNAADLARIRAELEQLGHPSELLFLEASDGTLLKRYSETRRRHPLGALPDSIAAERVLLAPLREQASVTIDTENLRARELRRVVIDRFGGGDRIRVVLTSFGFKKGLPPEADLVFDARGLDNPHGVPELRPRSGFHPEVRDYVLHQAAAERLLELFETHVRLQVPGSVDEGRMHLTVAIGCTGGQHRSVALTRELAHRLRNGGRLAEAAVELVERHRDVDRSGDDD